MMEVDNPGACVPAGIAHTHVMKAAPHSKTGRQILLHPLAIVTICDHCTRVKVGGSRQSADSRILGLLFGFQDGLQASITDAIELQYEVVNGEIKISPDYVNEKKELYTAVYPNSEIMGWYAVGSEVEANALNLHRTMNTWNESPILLLLNPSAEAAKDLPVSLFESELHVVDDKPTLLFVSVPFQLETAQAERISVEHVVKATPTEGVSSVDLHVEAVSTSLKALYMRIQSLLKFLQFTKDGTVPPDYAILRQVANLCNQLPAAESPSFQSAFLNEYSDSMVVTYLASVTKLTTLANEVAEKFAMTYGEKHRRRGL